MTSASDPAPGPFVLPADLAEACLTRLGATAPVDVAGVATLVERLAQMFPRGSTAKLEAMADGRVPPGSDPALVADTWLARPELGWSCWAASTLLAALVGAGGELSTAVIATRRIDPGAVPVDFHAYVELDDGRRRWLVDPYFRLPPIPETGGDAIRPGQWAEAYLDGPTWYSSIGSPAYTTVLRYRSVSGPLDGGDVDTFCRLSETHSGLPSRPLAELARPDGMVKVSLDRDGAVRLRRWRAQGEQVWSATCEVVELDQWDDAEKALAELVV